MKILFGNLNLKSDRSYRDFRIRRNLRIFLYIFAFALLIALGIRIREQENEFGLWIVRGAAILFLLGLIPLSVFIGRANREAQERWGIPLDSYHVWARRLPFLGLPAFLIYFLATLLLPVIFKGDVQLEEYFIGVCTALWVVALLAGLILAPNLKRKGDGALALEELAGLMKRATVGDSSAAQRYKSKLAVLTFADLRALYVEQGGQELESRKWQRYRLRRRALLLAFLILLAASVLLIPLAISSDSDALQEVVGVVYLTISLLLIPFLIYCVVSSFRISRHEHELRAEYIRFLSDLLPSEGQAYLLWQDGQAQPEARSSPEVEQP